jgi:polysaccharide deacetylase family protein (PEP-CTERM system associated)
MNNILSIDVEEWFHPEALHHLFNPETWDKQQNRVEQNIDKLLELFAKYNATATFFILGWIGRKYPEMVKKIAAAGHEIASHSDSHRMVTKLDSDTFRKDLEDSIKVLEDVSGQKIIGFRAPTFSLVKETRWAWDIMLELGLEYDSSVYPIYHDRYGIPDAPRFPYIVASKKDRKLIEFPMPTLKIFKKNIPFGGGGYLRIFPLLFTKFALRKFNAADHPVIFYAHPWEFDTGQPRLDLGRIQTWRHYYNISNNYNKLESLLKMSEWISFRDYLKKNNILQIISENS